MSENKAKAAKATHPSHHWGPFADDPWSPDLDCVSGAVWEEVVRRAARSRLDHEAAAKKAAEREKLEDTKEPPAS